MATLFLHLKQVSMVEVDRGFTPWVQSVAKKLGRAVTGIQKMPFGTDNHIISMFNEVPNVAFNDARLRNWVKIISSFHFIISF